MKNIIFVLSLLVSSNSFAGGSTTGAGPGKEIGDMRIERLDMQVYYMGKKQAELEFATADKNGNQVNVHSLRPEEISDRTLLEGLQRSRQSKKWEAVQERYLEVFNKNQGNPNSR